MLDNQALERLRKLGGDRLAGRMIALFLEAAPQRIQAARAGQEAGDFDQVRRAAHSLKSSAGNIGASLVREIADCLEQHAEAERAEPVFRLVNELELAFAEVRERLPAGKNQ
jgi:HPt (histidine-containing phosphotransfer) domain-containing protein